MPDRTTHVVLDPAVDEVLDRMEARMGRPIPSHLLPLYRNDARRIVEHEWAVANGLIADPDEDVYDTDDDITRWEACCCPDPNACWSPGCHAAETTGEGDR